MPASPTPLELPVHPHQLEVQEFAAYELILDARAAVAFAADRIPGATSLPASLATKDPEQVLAPLTKHMAADAAILVYCDQGGLDALHWAQPLRDAGWDVDVLAGGWPNYRRWVDAGLELLPRMLRFRLFQAPPASGLCRVLEVLRERGEQTLDLAILAGQFFVPGLQLKGDAAPTQSSFESLLLDELRHFDPQQPVWVRTTSWLHPLVFPPALRDALERAEKVTVDVPADVRARAWSERLHSMNVPATTLLQTLEGPAVQLPESLRTRWGALCDEGRAVEGLAVLISQCIDVQADVPEPAELPRLRLPSLEAEGIASSLDQWMARGDPRPLRP